MYQKLLPQTNQLPASRSLELSLPLHPNTLTQPLPLPPNPITHANRRMPRMQHPKRSLDHIQLIPAPPHLGTNILKPSRTHNLMQKRVTPQPKSNRPRPNNQPSRAEFRFHLRPDRTLFKTFYPVHILHRLDAGFLEREAGVEVFGFAVADETVAVAGEDEEVFAHDFAFAGLLFDGAGDEDGLVEVFDFAYGKGVVLGGAFSGGDGGLWGGGRVDVEDGGVVAHDDAAAVGVLFVGGDIENVACVELGDWVHETSDSVFLGVFECDFCKGCSLNEEGGDRGRCEEFAYRGRRLHRLGRLCRWEARKENLVGRGRRLSPQGTRQCHSVQEGHCVHFRCLVSGAVSRRAPSLPVTDP